VQVRWGFVFVCSAVACAGVRAAAAQALDGPSAEPNVETPSAEVSKPDCFAKHEEAQVARRAGRLLAARADLQACSRASCPGAIRADCVDWLDQVTRSLPSVVVTARAHGEDLAEVRVFIDGQVVTERLSGAAIEVDPGLHQLRFESPPWPAVERSILVSQGVKNRAIDVEFAPAAREAPAQATLATPPPAPSPTPPRRLTKVDYLLGGAALAGLATFAVSGLSALSERSRLEQSCAGFCTPAEERGLHTRLILADVGLGVAAAALVVLYLHVKL
jgi:hypothetical protein